MRKVLGMIFLLDSLATGVAGGCEPEGRAVTVEQHKKLQPAGPGKQSFDVTRHSIPLSEIIYSVPRDTIPALLDRVSSRQRKLEANSKTPIVC